MHSSNGPAQLCAYYIMWAHLNEYYNDFMKTGIKIILNGKTRSNINRLKLYNNLNIELNNTNTNNSYNIIIGML